MILSVWLLMTNTALAEAPRPLSIDEVATRERLLETFDAHFFPDRVAEDAAVLHQHGPRVVLAHRAAETEEGFGCLTTLVAELKLNWDLFDDEERAEMTSILAPWKDDLMEPTRMDEEGPPPPNSPCFAYQYDNYTESSRFSVQWEDNAITESEAEDFLEELEYAWEVEVEEMGWEAPAGISRYPMMVLVPRNNSYAGAYTTVEYCSGVGYVPYVVAYSGSFNSGNWWKTMACHEFNHASQFAYGYAHEFWWWEATATWIEEYVYPPYNDWADMTYVYSMVPYIGMNASAGNSNDEYLFYHTYAMAVWAFFLDEYVGGPEFVERSWARSSLESGQYGYWMPDTIEDMGEDFDEVYQMFMAVNATMDYSESQWYENPEVSDTVSNLPDSGTDGSSDRPQSLGQNFIKFRSGAGEEGASLRVSFDGDDAADWYAVLARGSDELEEYVTFDLNASGEGTAEIAFDGDEDVYLVVSPRDEDAQGYNYNWNYADDFEYSWEAELVYNDSGAGDGEDTGGSGGDGLGDDGDEFEICGCSTGKGTGWGFAWFFVALGLVRRRR